MNTRALIEALNAHFEDGCEAASTAPARLRTARSYREIRRINGHAMARLVWRRARDARRELEREIAQMVLRN